MLPVHAPTFSKTISYCLNKIKQNKQKKTRHACLIFTAAFLASHSMKISPHRIEIILLSFPG